MFQKNFNLGNFVNRDVVNECSDEEADAISREWLSANGNFQSENFIVDAESEALLRKRNREEQMHASSSTVNQINRPSSSTSDPKPKWFKRQ